MKTNEMTKSEIRRITWISASVLFALTALLTACSPSNAVSPLTQTLYGPSGHPEQGLVMEVRSITGYIDANGNKTEGKLDVIDQKLSKLLDAKGDCVSTPTAAASPAPTAAVQVQLPVDVDPATGNQVISITQVDVPAPASAPTATPAPVIYPNKCAPLGTTNVVCNYATPASSGVGTLAPAKAAPVTIVVGGL